MVSPLPCRTPRRPRRAQCTSGRRRWPRLTKRASRSARKASGLTQEGGGGQSPPLLFFAVFFRPWVRSAYFCIRPKPALRTELPFFMFFLAAFAPPLRLAAPVLS